jgi:hypothetical protein
MDTMNEIIRKQARTLIQPFDLKKKMNQFAEIWTKKYDRAIKKMA